MFYFVLILFFLSFILNLIFIFKDKIINYLYSKIFHVSRSKARDLFSDDNINNLVKDLFK